VDDIQELSEDKYHFSPSSRGCKKRQAHGSGTAAAAGDAPRGDLRTPPERAAENNVVHRGCNCVRVAIIPCVLCYRQPSGFPSGLAVRRVVCKCVIQAIKDKKLNTSKTPPELNFQNSHLKSQPRFCPIALPSQSENDFSTLGGQPIHSPTHIHYEYGKVCLRRLSCAPFQRRPVSAIDR
jgi:hypothetical protein